MHTEESSALGFLSNALGDVQGRGGSCMCASSKMAPQLSAVPVTFFCNGLLFLALPSTAIVDHTRSFAVQDGSSQKSWKEVASENIS